MKVLVIGGCGFVGSHVVDALVEGRIGVRVLDRRPEAFRSPIKGVEYVIGDYAHAALLTEAVMGVDAVIHLASATVPATSNLDPSADIRGNLLPTVQLIEISRAVGVRNIVYLSSGGTVYGMPQTDPIAENHPLQPVSSYGIVKTAIEKYLHMEHHLHGLRYCVLRASNPYGPRQGHTGVQGVIGTYLWNIARGDPIEVWGDGQVVRDFIHVKDLASLCRKSLESAESGLFNAGSGDGVSIRKLVDIICQTTGRDITPIYKPGRNFDVPRVVLDIEVARKAFSWDPGTRLEMGIADFWQWVQAQHEMATKSSEA